MSTVKYLAMEVMEHKNKSGIFMRPSMMWRNLADGEFLLRYDNDMAHMAYMLFTEPKRLKCFSINNVMVNMYDFFDDRKRFVL